MAYHDRDNDIKKVGRAGLVMRILGIVLIVVLVGSIVLYRNTIWAGVTGMLALSRDDEPIPVLSLEKGPLQIEVQADGEIVGMEMVPVATPTTGAGTLKLAWLIAEGSPVNPADQVRQHKQLA
jgi:hypothetical protein